MPARPIIPHEAVPCPYVRTLSNPQDPEPILHRQRRTFQSGGDHAPRFTHSRHFEKPAIIFVCPWPFQLDHASNR
jgi:hypothetical protein